MPKFLLGSSPTSVILRVKLLNSSVSTGAGLTGLVYNSTGLNISAIKLNEATTTSYTTAGSTIETITTLGTYAAPTATKCRFKEVDATNHPGVYEIQLADARFASTTGVVVSISGATNLAQCDIEVECTPLSANVTQIDGNATNGNNATLNLKQLNIVNSAGSAIIATASGGNGHGITATGNGTGNGIMGTGGATSGDGLAGFGSGTGHGLDCQSGSGSTGNGINAVALSTNGNGMNAQGNGSTGNGIYANGNSGYGMYCYSSSSDAFRASGAVNGMVATSNGGGAGTGFAVSGGSGGGHGMTITGLGGGEGLRCVGSAAGNGLRCIGGNSSGAGLYCDSVSGGAYGAVFVGRTTYAGLYSVGGATSGAGILAKGSGTGHGMDCQSGSGATGNGLNALSNATNGNGFATTGTGTGAAELMTAGVTGNGMSVNGGATSGTALVINSANSCAVDITSGTSSAPGTNGIRILGAGSAAGVLITGGSTGNGMSVNGNGPGSGIALQGGVSAGHGLYAKGGDSGAGTSAGSAMYLDGSTTAQAGTVEGDGCGLVIVSRSQVSPAVLAKGTGNLGSGIYVRTASNGIGLLLTGSGNGAGIYASGGTTGNGATFQGGATSGSGLLVNAGATGVGLLCQGGATSGNAVSFIAESGDSNGLLIAGYGTGHGISSAGGAGNGTRGISASGSLYGLYAYGGTAPGSVGIMGTCGSTNGAGIYATNISGAAVRFISQGTDYDGMIITGNGVGSGLKLVGGTYDLQAREVQGIKTKTDQLVFTVANQVDTNVVDWKGSAAPAMTGDAYARLGAPAGASVSADIAAVKVDTAVIKVKTDQLTFTVANKVDSTATVSGSVTLGAGSITASTFATGAIDANAFAQAAADKVWATSSRALTDKSGFSLSSSQTFNLTGNVSGSVGSVTAAVTVGTNNDKTGYALTAAYDPAKTAAQASALSITDGEVLAIKTKTDQLIFTGAYLNSQTKGMDTDVISAAAVSAAAVSKIQSGLSTSIDMTTINGKLDTIYTTEGTIINTISAVDGKTQSIVDVLPSSGRISNLALTDQIDTVALSDVLTGVLSMVSGRFRKDYPSTGEVTFFKSNSTDVAFVVQITDTERTKV